MTALFLIFSATVAGCFLYRMRGGAPSWPRPIEQMLFCLAFLFSMGAFGVVWWATGSAYAGAVAASLTGHGAYFLSLAVKAVEPETFDFLIRPFFGQDPRSAAKFNDWRGINESDLTDDQRAQISQAMLSYGMRKLYWRNVCGLSMTGLIVSLLPGIAVAFWDLPAGIFLALSGAVKGPAYMVAHRFGWNTEGGEYINGGAVWFLCSVITVTLATVCA